jgi:hypothetical protein
LLTQTEIIEFKDWVIGRNSAKIKEQELDQSFFDDTYELPIPVFVDKKYILRTGFVAGMANSITQQVISYQPKVYTDSRNKGSLDGANRIASLCNKWCKTLSKQSVNPFRDTFKTLTFTRGESWIYIPHDDELMRLDGWQELYPDRLPVYFMMIDPSVVYHEPSEDIDGKPRRVVLSYKRSVGDLKANYPNWKPPVGTKTSDQLDFWMYVSKDVRYAEVDEKPLYMNNTGKLMNGDGMMSNPYGLVNFVHRYTGYGSDSKDKDPSTLAFTRTRMIRDKIKEDAAMATDFRYNQSELVWKIRNIYWPIDREKPENLFAEYNSRPGAINVIHVPSGVEPKVEESRSLGADAYAYRNFVKSDLNMEHPASIRGMASGTSGRQEDILGAAGLAMYDSPVEAISSLWAEAFDIAIKICSLNELKILPAGLKEGDKDSYTDLRIDLKKDDLVARDRMVMAGRTMVNDGQLSLRSHLIKNVGMTEEEADDEIDEILSEKYMFQSPEIAAFLGAIAAQNSGMADRLEAYKQAINGTPNINVGTPIGSKGGQPRTGNIQSETGMNMADVGNTGGGIRSTPMGGQ